MEQIAPQHWALIHFGLVFLITCAHLLVVYVLSDSSNPPAGLGLYTVYFMAALLGWIAYTLQQVAQVSMPLDVPSVAAVLNSYLLFLAAGQRAERSGGRAVLGLVCLVACLSVFFLDAGRIFLVQTSAAALFFAATALVSAHRGLRKGNTGDAITSGGSLLMVFGSAIALYLWYGDGHRAQAQAVAFGVHSIAYVLVAVGFLASVVIEYQSHLSRLATEDSLTRLLNRRGLETALQVTMASSARRQLPTSALVLDIDRFKEVNNNFGHDAGDQVICRVAECLRRQSRASDVVARTGGEEFLLVLPETDLEAARILAGRIREAITARPLLANNQRIAVTVSIGVASITGTADLDRLITEADRAMQLAKRDGSNRVASVENRPIRLSSSAGPA